MICFSSSVSAFFISSISFISLCLFEGKSLNDVVSCFGACSDDNGLRSSFKYPGSFSVGFLGLIQSTLLLEFKYMNGSSTAGSLRTSVIEAVTFFTTISST